MKRVSYNAGSFYPNSINELKQIITTYNDTLNKREDINSLLSLKPKAIISPQNKYEYCGNSINLAHRVLSNSKVRRVVVIGASHHVEFNGISGSFYNTYQTPIRDINIDIEYLNVIDKNFGIEFIQEAHFLEYSTETQIPFIANYQPNSKVIELIYGNNSEEKLTKIITWLLKDSLTSVVVCSDLSYLFTYEQAKVIDAKCLSGISQMDNNILENGCASCDLIGIKALNTSATTLKMSNLILDYNTANYSNSKVIGYASVAYFKGTLSR